MEAYLRLIGCCVQAQMQVVLRCSRCGWCGGVIRHIRNRVDASNKTTRSRFSDTRDSILIKNEWAPERFQSLFCLALAIHSLLSFENFGHTRAVLPTPFLCDMISFLIFFSKVKCDPKITVEPKIFPNPCLRPRHVWYYITA